ncbi:MAG: hypothetical protein D6685_03700 [Bacteroidetes bacterium]|nr:MAG: hypothetical protein D6685_03700 [Bacteroidota bacterium]
MDAAGRAGGRRSGDGGRGAGPDPPARPVSPRRMASGDAATRPGHAVRGGDGHRAGRVHRRACGVRPRPDLPRSDVPAHFRARASPVSVSPGPGHPGAAVPAGEAGLRSGRQPGCRRRLPTRPTGSRRS